MRIFKTVVNLSLIVLAAVATVDAKKLKGDDLSNMIIEGENRLNMRPRVPDVDWDPNVHKESLDMLKDNTVLGDLKPPSIAKPVVILPEKSVSEKTASPWMETLYEPPVLTLSFKGADQKKKVDWTFLVKDSQGQVFYELKRKAALPETLTWDGFGKGNESLKVGYDYSYSFSTVDEAGNPQRFAGKPFRLDSFRHKKSGGVVTCFQPESLFRARDVAKLSVEGRELLTEVKDTLRTPFGRKVEIVTYEDDQKFGSTRSKSIKEFLQKTLDIPDDKISVVAQTLKQGGGYRHVDIVAK